MKKISLGKLPLALLVLLATIWLSGEKAYASVQNNTNTCPTSGFTGLTDFTINCTGTQNFPDDGVGNVPISGSVIDTSLPLHFGGVIQLSPNFSVSPFYWDQSRSGDLSVVVASFSDTMGQMFVYGDLSSNPIVSYNCYGAISCSLDLAPFTGATSTITAIVSSQGDCSSQALQGCLNMNEYQRIYYFPPYHDTIQSMSPDGIGIMVGISWICGIATFFGFVWLLRHHK